MDNSKTCDEFSSLVMDKDEESKARNVLELMRKYHPIILTFGSDEGTYGLLSDITCQHIAEQGMKEILDVIKSTPIREQHLYCTAVLSAIKEIHLVKKYLWKDKVFIATIPKLLNIANKNKDFIMLRSFVASILQGTLLGGTPEVYYEVVARSGVLDLIIDILKNRREVTFKQSYEEFLMILLLLCQNNKSCAERCGDLSAGSILQEFSHWEVLDDDLKEKAVIASRCIYHMANHDVLPDHKKIILDKFSEHIQNKNNTYKRMETIICLNCSKVESCPGEYRFKKCSRCRVALYCSKECQVEHWRTAHSKVCNQPTTSSSKH